ncbi:hypothetical protein OAB57_02175 [Bacteriovoracaceae bacterium]|nr:hypothetical protein [Bacteriovoracaceae bacterium]
MDTRDCDSAITVLESAGRDLKNARYVIALATAYACKANYSSSTFYGTDLSRIVGTEGGILGSLTKLTISEMTSPTDSTYVSLWTAIDTLVYSGGVSTPTVANRALIFSDIEADDINLFALYLVINQLGKYLYFYGNANPITGVKGGGAVANGNTNNLSNGCLYDYNPSDATLDAVITAARASGGVGSCTSSASGNDFLSQLPNTKTTKRLCEGVVLFNIFLDILVNISLPTDATQLTSAASELRAACSSNSAVGELCSVYEQSQCEEEYATTVQSDKLQAYFFLVFETLFI